MRNVNKQGLISFTQPLSQKWTNPKVLNIHGEPVHLRACSSLPSLHQYHIILLGNGGGMCLQTSCPGLLHEVESPTT